MTQTFAGENIWIIGASSGIGAALAAELAAGGARVALSARRAAELDKVNAGLTNPANHAVMPLDVSDAAGFDAAAAKVAALFGRIDRVVFLSALYTPSAVEAITRDELRKIVDVNLLGAFYCAQSVVPVLRAQGGGQLALCGSVAGYRGLANSQPYAATKAAVISLAETLRLEEAQNNIDIRLISPGFVKTPLTDKNDFAMPMMISAEEAASSLARQLRGCAFEITFPKKFTTIMKFLRLVPDVLYFPMAARFR